MKSAKSTGSRRIDGESGQSTIEFALTLMLIVIFFLAFTQLTLLFGFANYAHYATFMAARAQLSAGDLPDDQTTRAQTVLTKMLKNTSGTAGQDRWPGLARGYGGTSDVRGADFGEGNHYNSGDSKLSWMRGVRYTFRSRLFMIPLGGNASTNSVTLTSESWLGREPSYSDCSREVGFFDNGC